MRKLIVEKGQALGNDYLVIDAGELEEYAISPELARRLCDRHAGLGADGVLLVWPGESPVRMRIFNPDGSTAEKSGNGLRILAAWLHARGIVGREPFRVALAEDVVELRVESELEGGVLDVVVEMGRADFSGRAVRFEPVAGQEVAEEVVGVELELAGGGSAAVHTVSLGNPHCVVFPERLEREDFLERAPALSTHPAFGAGTNVQFARVLGPGALEAWIWERGAGETLASGSSACAAAAAAVRAGLLGKGDIGVEMEGGTVDVRIRPDGSIRLRGPAQMVYRASVRADVLEAWEGVL